MMRWKRTCSALRILLAAILGTKIVAVLIVGFGFLMAAVPWRHIGLIWIYCLVWVFIEDWAKLHLYKHLKLGGRRHRSFVDRVQQGLHSHASR